VLLALKAPTVAGRPLRLQLHLFSPASRVLAVSSDLASFWTDGYPAVRADLRGRYRGADRLPAPR
jgi:ATP-dependent helicase HrpB